MGSGTYDSAARVRQLIKPFENGIWRGLNEARLDFDDAQFQGQIDQLSHYLSSYYREQMDGLAMALEDGTDSFGGPVMTRVLKDTLVREVAGIVHPAPEGTSERMEMLTSAKFLMGMAVTSDPADFERGWNYLLEEIHEQSSAIADSIERFGEVDSSFETLPIHDLRHIDTLKQLTGNRENSLSFMFFRNGATSGSAKNNLINGEIAQVNNVALGIWTNVELWNEFEGAELTEMAHEMLFGLREFSEPASYLHHGWVPYVEDVDVVCLKDGEVQKRENGFTIRPANGFALRKIIRRTVEKAIESARAMGEGASPRLTNEWIEGTRTYVMTDADERDIFAAFEEGGVYREQMQEWAGKLGDGGEIAFDRHSIRVKVPRRKVPSIAPLPGGGSRGGILGITNGSMPGGRSSPSQFFMPRPFLR